MSSGEKQPLAQARKIAWLVVERMRPYCERIEVAGSIRRGEPWVGDIEIVAIPKVSERVKIPAGLFTPAVMEPYSLLWGYLDGLLQKEKIAHAAAKGWGQTIRKFVLTTERGQEYKIDVFTAVEGNWGNILLIRTGSREFSTFMVSGQERRGALPAGYQHKGGWLHNPKGEVVPLLEEADWFAVCGLDFVPPEQRKQFGMPSASPCLERPSAELPPRALSIRQPWLWLIINGLKKAENRSWVPPDWILGKRIALHASKKMDSEAGVQAARDMAGPEAEWYLDTAELALGCIQATAVVAGYVYQTVDDSWVKVGDHPAMADYEPDLDPFLIGEYGWVLADVQKLPEPIPAVGKLNLWLTNK